MTRVSLTIPFSKHVVKSFSNHRLTSEIIKCFSWLSGRVIDAECQTSNEFVVQMSITSGTSHSKKLSWSTLRILQPATVVSYCRFGMQWLSENFRLESSFLHAWWIHTCQTHLPWFIAKFFCLGRTLCFLDARANSHSRVQQKNRHQDAGKV